MIKVSRVSPWLAAAGLWCAALTVNATPVTLIGDTINYVYDDSQVALAVFGTPTISGDAIRFTPSTFRAESLNGAGTDSVMAEFVFSRVYSQAGTDLGLFEAFEFGDYEIIGDGAINAELLLTLGNNRTSESSFIAASLGDSGSTGNLQFWDLAASLDPAAIFSAATDDIAVTIRNTLSATTGPSGGAAWIQKKFAFGFASQGTGTPVTPPSEVVPAPGVAWLIMSGLVLLGFSRHRQAGRK